MMMVLVPRFVDELVKGLEGLLASSADAVFSAAFKLVDIFYDPLSPWVKRQLHLPGGGQAARVDVSVEGARLADTVALEFLLRGVPSEDDAKRLAKIVACALKGADDWTESCAERRAELARRRRVLDQARAGIQRLLAGGPAGGEAVVVGSDSESGSGTPSPPPDPAARKMRRV
jgi:hypothetical protein